MEVPMLIIITLHSPLSFMHYIKTTYVITMQAKAINTFSQVVNMQVINWSPRIASLPSSSILVDPILAYSFTLCSAIIANLSK